MIALPKQAALSVAEFQAWQPPDRADHRWQLVEGEPVCMAPASENHGAIQSEAAILLGNHLRQCRPGCRVIVAPGIVPRVRSATNQRIPDLGVTCAPPSGGQIVAEPLLLIEILSPSNEGLTRANVWTYTTIPSVMEILLISSVRIEGELLTRGADGSWPDLAPTIPDGGDVELTSIGFRAPLQVFYAGTSLMSQAQGRNTGS